MRAIIITYPAPNNINKLIDISENDFVIAVDKGLEEAVNQQIKIDLVIGDFDSLTNKDLLKKYEYIKLDERKNYTDTLYSLLHVKKNVFEQIYVLGGIKGERVDHFYANLSLFNYVDNLEILDDNTKIIKLNKGINKIKKEKEYISIFPFPSCVVNLTGFSYNLFNYEMKFMDPLGVSNYVEDDVGVIEILSGNAIVFKTKK